MENYFSRYMNEWFQEFLDEHENDEVLVEQLFNRLLTQEALDEWPEGGLTMLEYLRNDIDAEFAYSRLYKEEIEVELERALDKHQEFIYKILTKAADALGLRYDFMKELMDDMAYHIIDYDRPVQFFNDLQRGGCASGMIGMFIYQSDCHRFYMRYADDMEEYKEDMEDELGEPIRQRDCERMYHYYWMCWLCYEELAFALARHLYEDEF